MKANKGGLHLIISAVVAAVHAVSGSKVLPSKVVEMDAESKATLPCSFDSTIAEERDFASWTRKPLNGDSEEIALKYFRGIEHFASGYKGRLNFSNNFEKGDAGITFNKLAVQDNGIYECLVRMMNEFPSKSVIIELIVRVKPSIPVCDTIVKPQFGQNINLTCHSVEGIPEPKYSWQSYDAKDQSRPLPGIAEGGLLMLKNVSTDTSGYYICISKNSVGESKCNITVIARPPSMNVGLYAGIIGGVLAAIIIISILVYCCCCKKSNKDYEATETENTFQPKHEAVRIRGPSKEELGDEDEERPHM
ncbi:cell surface A33 antigen [Erythrolamprus reginae]|uniref:cell surface A33 antigen n=1 Tax=Erythrolamprus reginae TaxID=121349 RepID=UPI00396C847B